MKKKSLKNITAAVLAVVLAVSGLSGCGKSEKKESGNQEKVQETVSQESSEQGKDEVQAETEGQREVVTIRYMSKSGLSDTAVEAIKRKVMEELQIDLVWEDVDKNVYDEKVNLGFAGGNIADIVFISTSERLAEAVENNAILPMDEAIAKDPNYSKLPPEYFDSCKYDGKIYTIPTVNKVPVTMLYRTDWAEKVGYQTPPSNTDELYDMLYKFTYEDPDGNGKDDTVGFTMIGAFTTTNPIWQLFVDARPTLEMGLYYDENDKMFKSSILDEEGMTAALTWLNKAYQEGVLDKEWIVDSKSTDEEKFVTGKTGMAFKEPFQAKNRQEKLRKLQPDAEIGVLPNFQARTGMVYRVGDNRAQKEYVTANCKYPERAMEFLMYMYGPEGIFVRAYGIEGETYTIEDGKLVFKNPDDVQMLLEEHLVYTSVFDLNPPVEDAQMNAYKKAFDGTTIVKDPVRYMASSPKTMEIGSDVNKAATEFLAKVIIGEKPVSSYPELIATVEKLGLRDALDELNANAGMK